MTMSFENSSQLGNFGMGTRGDIPRGLIDNTIGNREEVGNFRDFDHLSRNARMAANAIDAINVFAEEGRSLGGSPRLRAKSFAYLRAWICARVPRALVRLGRDRSPGELAGTEVPEFPSSAGMTAALEMLDSAIAVLGRDTRSRLQSRRWMAAPVDLSKDRYRQIIRSYKARFRAGLGRTPTERGAADWDAILADATNGITNDLNVSSRSQAAGPMAGSCRHRSRRGGIRSPLHFGHG